VQGLDKLRVADTGAQIDEGLLGDLGASPEMRQGFLARVSGLSVRR